MADNMSIHGYGNYGVGGYIPQRRKGGVEQEQQPKQQTLENNNLAEKQVDPSKVMDYLSSNNVFVNTNTTQELGTLDEATKERVGSSMQHFEMVYGVIRNEFGEENAPMVMDMVMDKLMGMS